jgi:hypothetical protein
MGKQTLAPRAIILRGVKLIADICRGPTNRQIEKETGPGHKFCAKIRKLWLDKIAYWWLVPHLGF